MNDMIEDWMVAGAAGWAIAIGVVIWLRFFLKEDKPEGE